ncbi:aspartate kinase [Pyrococcus sp. ST04]|uniref:aspartate kinase n=1 Tax=Pyrococcus sp. ST04 TaxID=1183377 RepID=UPI0002605E65|nr:aspartate kinase [Pyrococcus sp. ST04]AFK22585.1 aspartate kinase [Pyrococcus sp. ST04]
MVYKPFVIKFGGSSVRYAFEEALSLVRHISEGRPVVVVVSALKGVTDALIRLADGDEKALLEVLEIHEQILQETGVSIDHLFQELEKTVNAKRLFPSRESYVDAVATFGERISAEIFAEGLRLIGVEARAVDSKDVLVAKGNFGNAEVDFERSMRRIPVLIKLLRKGIIPVVTGYYGDLNGLRATFGRGGSDYSATSLASLLNARAVVIMSDVEGIYTADPRLVPEAKLIPYLSYEEASTAAKLGMKALHWRAIDPVEGRMPVILGKTKDWRFGTLVFEDSSEMPIVVHRVLGDEAEISVVSRKAPEIPYKPVEEGPNYIKIRVPREEFVYVLREVHRMVIDNEGVRSSDDSELWARV